MPDPNTPATGAISPGSDVPPDCTYVGNTPFGRLKSNQKKLATDFGGENDPPEASEKSTVISEHKDKGLTLCDDPLDNFTFMQKGAPLRAKVSLSGFGVQVEVRFYHTEGKGLGCGICAINTFDVDLIIPQAAVDHDNPAVNLILVQESISPNTGWGFATQPWDLDVNTGLANLGSDDGSAFAIFGEWNMILNYYWFDGFKNVTAKTFPTAFSNWIKRTNSTGSCNPCETIPVTRGGGGQNSIGGGRCLAVSKTGSKLHCGEDSSGPQCVFNQICMTFNPFDPNNPPTNFVAYNITFEIIFKGFTSNGVLLDFDDPLSGIPSEVWFPEGS